MLYGKARRLQWLQAMGAGVDWVLVPELPARIVVTRAPGIFGPWMSEYVLGWCSWVTQKTEVYRAAQRERRWREDVLRAAARQDADLGGRGRHRPRDRPVARAVGMHVIGVSRSGERVPAVERVYRPAVAGPWPPPTSWWSWCR